MEKEELQGITLQISAIFTRLDALKKSLTEEGLITYNDLIKRAKEGLKENYDVNVDQLDQWYQ